VRYSFVPWLRHLSLEVYKATDPDAASPQRERHLVTLACAESEEKGSRCGIRAHAAEMP
jgi:hypothetical protein